MAASFIRIVSDVHFGDRFSRVQSIDELSPLLDGPSGLVLNGDTLDTRTGPDPAGTARSLEAVRGFAAKAPVPVSLLTGNHDPDVSASHMGEFSEGRVLAVHGDILYDAIVPWAKDAPRIRSRIIAALAAIPEDRSRTLEGRLEAFRKVCATLPQTHQSERNPLRYAAGLASNTVWPPTKAVQMFRAWSELPERAGGLAARHRPQARVVVVGHTHRPGVWKSSSGVTVVNTGSFCRPFGGIAADVYGSSVEVRRLEHGRLGFRAGKLLKNIPLQ